MGEATIGRGMATEPRQRLPHRQRRWLYGGAAVILALGAAAWVVDKRLTPAASAQTPRYTVGYGNVVETVSVSGSLQPQSTYNLDFTGGTGTLGSLRVKIGQSVKAGQVLATLDDPAAILQVGTDKASVAQAEASVAAAQANLAVSQQGPTTAALQIAEAAVSRAELTLQAGQQQLQLTQTQYSDRTTAQAAVVSAQNAVNAAQVSLQTAEANAANASTNAQQQLATAQQNAANAQASLSLAQAEDGSVTSAAVVAAYATYQTQLADSLAWQQANPTTSTSGTNNNTGNTTGNTTGGSTNNPYAATLAIAQTQYDNLNAQYTALQSAQSQYEQATAAVSAAQNAVNEGNSNAVTQAQTQLQTAEDNLASAQAAYNDRTAQAAAVQQAQNTVAQDQVAVTSAKASLLQTKQPPTSATIDEEEASIAGAQAGLQSAQANLQTAEQTVSDLTLTAPISGVVTAVGGQVGQAVTPAQPVATIDSSDASGMQLNLQVPESNIGSIKAGDPLTFTVPALAGQTFSGSVVQVDPTPATTSNVTEYTVIAATDNASGSLRDGMTANVTIQTATATHVLTIPAVSLVDIGPLEGVYVVGTRPAGDRYFGGGSGGSFAGSGSSGGSGGGFAGSGSSGGSGGSFAGASGSGSSGGGFAGSGSSGGSGGGFAGSGSSGGSGGGFAGSGSSGGSGGSFAGSGGSSAATAHSKALTSFGNPPKGTYFQPVQVGLFGTNTVQITAGLKAGEIILAVPPGSASAAVTSGKSPTLRGGFGGFAGFGGGGGGAVFVGGGSAGGSHSGGKKG